MKFTNYPAGHDLAEGGKISGLLMRLGFVALIGLGVIVFASNASAQDSAGEEAQAAPQEGPRLVSSGWLKQTSPVPDNPETKFNMISYQSRDTNGNVVIEVGIFEVPEQPKRMIVVLPHVAEGHLIPAGIGLRVDENEAKVGQFVFCNQSRCQGELQIEDALITEMKAGNNLVILTRQASDGEAVGVALSLEGFTAAYDGAGVDAAQAAARQEQYDNQFSEALKRRAEQNRQRLQQQQQN
ncbi:MAG: invasion associated locus B family protein [Pseudomonadota bacterium]